MFSTKKVNNKVVKALKLESDNDKREIRGHELFPFIHDQVFLNARKFSGKTVVLSYILRECCGPKTQIIVFCSTLHKDPSWQSIYKWAMSKGISFTGFTSLQDGKKDILQNFIKDLSVEEVEEEEVEEEAEARFVSDYGMEA